MGYFLDDLNQTAPHVPDRKNFENMAIYLMLMDHYLFLRNKNGFVVTDVHIYIYMINASLKII